MMKLKGLSDNGIRTIAQSLGIEELPRNWEPNPEWESVFSLWFEEARGTEGPGWAVSLDEINEKGEQKTTETFRVYDEDEYDEALAYAKSEANRYGMRLVIDECYEV